MLAASNPHGLVGSAYLPSNLSNAYGPSVRTIGIDYNHHKVDGEPLHGSCFGLDRTIRARTQIAPRIPSEAYRQGQHIEDMAPSALKLARPPGLAPYWRLKREARTRSRPKPVFSLPRHRTGSLSCYSLEQSSLTYLPCGILVQTLLRFAPRSKVKFTQY